MPVHGDLAKVNDPNAIIEIAAGPPAPTLVPQKRGEGLRFGGRYADIIVRFIFKKAHMSNDDFRLFNAQGRLICNAWHQGKNPYGGMDPLNLGNAGPKEEWESLCRAAGHFGMPSFKVKPKMASRHGRQYVQAAGADGHWHTIFSVAKESRLKSMSLRHNFEICAGEGDDRTLQVLCDMAGRTMQFMNNEGEQVAFVQKSAKALIQTVALGSGSEMIIDVAPGVDWTVIVAAMIGIQQVGAHFIKDAFGNYVAPAMQDAALGAVGLDGVAGQVGQETDQAVHMMRWGQSIVQQFYNA